MDGSPTDKPRHHPLMGSVGRGWPPHEGVGGNPKAGLMIRAERADQRAEARPGRADADEWLLERSCQSTATKFVGRGSLPGERRNIGTTSAMQEDAQREASACLCVVAQFVLQCPR